MNNVQSSICNVQGNIYKTIDLNTRLNTRLTNLGKSNGAQAKGYD